MGAPVLTLDRVSVFYQRQQALDDVNLEIAAGERVGLVGPSGAGKSTLLGLCNGSVLCHSGAVRVLGRDPATLRSRDLQALRRRVATVHQQLHLVDSLSVVHNVNAGRLSSWSTARAVYSLVRPVDVEVTREVLDLFGIADRIFERTGSLSGGEQQRVALARALVQEPDLLLADEPVSSLDPARRDEVMDLLTLLTVRPDSSERPRTLVVSLHDFATARSRCDRIVGLRAGRVVFDLPATEVTDDVGAELYRIRR